METYTVNREIDRQQRKVFQNPHTQVVNLLQDKEKEHILAVDEMDLLLHKKFKFEKKIKNLNIKLNYAAVGPAIVFTNSDYTIKEVSYAFKVGEKSIKREINNMKSIKKPNTKRSRDYNNLVKNKS